jgi:hypothetical protein
LLAQIGIFSTHCWRDAFSDPAAGEKTPGQRVFASPRYGWA